MWITDNEIQFGGRSARRRMSKDEARFLWSCLIKKEFVSSECSSSVLFIRSVLSHKTSKSVCYASEKSDMMAFPPWGQDGRISTAGTHRRHCFYAANLYCVHLLPNLHCREGKWRHGGAALLTVSPSMDVIGFEAMPAGVNPARTWVTLVPKYIAKPRWLIRLEHWATGNTVKNSLSEIRLWQFRDDKPDKRPAPWKHVEINQKSALLTVTGKTYCLSIPVKGATKKQNLYWAEFHSLIEPQMLSAAHTSNKLTI